VIEVAVAIQFVPLELRAIDLFALNNVWGEDYPQVVEQPPLPPMTDDEGEVAPVVTFGPGPMNRHWWLSPAEDRLIQVQRDRLVLNWRRTGNAEYPRFSSLRKELRKRYAEFETFARKLEQAVRPNFVEVIYINNMMSGGGVASDLVEFMSPSATHHLGVPDELRVGATYIFDDGGQHSRLILNFDPQRDSNGSSFYLLSLAVRGKTQGQTWDDAVAFIDHAHGHIARSFSELTPATFQERWGRK
jgi:uncharacterized protein (TIGR04255 family)